MGSARRKLRKAARARRVRDAWDRTAEALASRGVEVGSEGAFVAAAREVQRVRDAQARWDRGRDERLRASLQRQSVEAVVLIAVVVAVVVVATCR